MELLSLSCTLYRNSRFDFQVAKSELALNTCFYLQSDLEKATYYVSKQNNKYKI